MSLKNAHFIGICQCQIAKYYKLGLFDGAQKNTYLHDFTSNGWQKTA